MTYCNVGQKATVHYRFGNQSSDTVYESYKAPIDVVISDASNGLRCWCFSGKGLHNDYLYDFFACGASPSWHDTGEFLQPYMNGAAIFDSIFGVRYGSGSITQVDGVSQRDGYIDIGNCDCANTCSLSVIYEGKTIFTVSGQSPCTFSVTCGDECPPDFCKVNCPAYPGYCCINCKKMDSLLLQLK